MRWRFWILFILFPLFAHAAPEVSMKIQSHARVDLRASIEATPALPYIGVPFVAKSASEGWESGMVSWVAVDGRGLIYELQRGDKAEPVLVLDHHGNVLRSWGKGNYTIPHSIRIDPEGNVWTVDAGSSIVIKYSPLGDKLMTIAVGEQPAASKAFSGATDIAFGPNGHLFITDGYRNARVLEYSADGKRIKQWGKPGTGPGEFNLPHAIQIGPEGIVYVADRENGRIEEFDLAGKYLREIPHLGRVYSLKLAGNVLWAGIQPIDQPVGSAGWLVKFDRKTGKMTGHIDVPDEHALHSVEQMPSGEPLTTVQNQLLWFRAR